MIRQLDNYFKDHLDDFHDDGNSHAAWENMGFMLDHQPKGQKGGFFVSRRIFWGIAALLLLLISTFIYQFWNHRQEVRQLHTAIDELKTELDGHARSEARTDTLILIAGPNGQLKAITPAQFQLRNQTDSLDQAMGLHNPQTQQSPKIFTIPNANSSQSDQVISNSVSPKQSSHPAVTSDIPLIPNDQSDPLPFQADTRATDTSMLVSPSLPNQPDSAHLSPNDSKESLVNQAQILQDSLSPEKISPSELTEMKKRERQQRRQVFYQTLSDKLGFRVGLGISGAGGGMQYRSLTPVIAIGPGLELTIGERLTVRSGIRVSGWSYELEGLTQEILSEDFLPRFPGVLTLEPGQELHEIKMSGTYFDIPLGVRYFFPVNASFDAFAGLDIKGGTFLNQDFKYEVYRGNDEFYRNSKASNIPWNWGSGRMSVGVAYAIKPRWKFEGALFFEKDFDTRGVEQFRYYLAGISGGLWVV